jgi:hypothetical protein
MRRFAIGLLKGLGLTLGNVLWWALLLLAASAMIARGGIVSALGIALDLLAALVALIVLLGGTATAFEEGSDGTDTSTKLAWIGFTGALVVVFLGFGAPLERGTAHSGRLLPAVVIGAGVATILYVVAFALREWSEAQEPSDTEKAEDVPTDQRTVGDLRLVLTDLPDDTVVSFRVLDDTAPWLAGDRPGSAQ